MRNLNIIICWEAWYWVESLSKTLCLFFMREWFHILTNSEYENRIRWWHIFSYLIIWEKEIQGYRTKEIDILLVMDKVWIEKHQDKMKTWWVVIYDPIKIKSIENYRKDLQYVWIEMQKIASQIIWMGQARNVIWAWALLWAIHYDNMSLFKETLTEIFRKKWEEVIKKNHHALDEWFNKVKESWIKVEFKLSPTKEKKRFMMHWNEAIVLWAIKAWVKYLSAYPMTPWSSVMTTIAKEAKRYDIVVSHVEDELASVNNVIWAWFAWIRAMTSTSWWWFALMWEALWLAWMIESPCVIVNAQRPWPSTWLPTMTGQWDLNMAVNAWQWDFPILVIAPWDHEECIRITFDAFNYAEKYQIPVIILTEKYLGDGYKSIDFIDFDDWSWKINRWALFQNETGQTEDEENVTNFKRYQITDSWISPRSLPWMKWWTYTATSYEHDEYWQATWIEDNEELIIAMQEKRMRKLESLKKDLPLPILHWIDNADITLIWWWATKWIILETIDELWEKWIKANFIQFQYLFPFKDEIEEMLKKANKLISIETNYSGQLASLIRQNTWIKMDYEIKTYTGKQISVNELVEKIETITK